MEGIEISPHLVRVVDIVRTGDGRWFTAAEIAEGTGVARRTANHHAQRLVALGIFERIECWPSNSYRWAPGAETAAGSYLGRIDRARAGLGLQPPRSAA